VRSTDGGHKWSSFPNPTKLGVSDFRCENNHFIGSGDHGYIAWSADGLSWTSWNEGIGEAILHASFSAETGLYVLGTESTVWTSKSPMGPLFASRTFTPGLGVVEKVIITHDSVPGYVAVDNKNEAFYTTDLVTWRSLGSCTLLNA
jgi:hypothetical protein